MKQKYIKTFKKALLVLFAFAAMLTGGTFHSCKFLDIDPYITDLFTLDTIFVKRDYTLNYLNNVYSFLVDNGSNLGSTSMSMPYSFISDEGNVGYKRGTTEQHNHNFFSNNQMTPELLNSFNRWATFYLGIRRANTFIKNVNQCKEATEMERIEWTGEALFVKASIYFELMLAWGPVPIVPDDPISLDTPLEELMVERNTWDECNDYVSGLLEQAIQWLPEQVLDQTKTGRATRNAARALLSRLTLYTASPLYNGQNAEFSGWKNKAGVSFLNPNKDMEKWAKAAVAAKQLVDLKPHDLHTVSKMDNTPKLPDNVEKADFPSGAGGIDHFHSYSDMFTCETTNASENIEILFSRQSSNTNSFNRFCAPHILEGYSTFFVPQNVVDAYYMADGRTIDNASAQYPYGTGYTSNDIIWSGEKSTNGFTLVGGTYKWYVNREMRFYANIAFNNSWYPSTTTPPNLVDSRDGKIAKFYADGKSGKNFAMSGSGYTGIEYPMTGYLPRKFLHSEDSWASNGRQKYKYNIVYRMAEVYLNYVETMNELDKSYTISGITVSRDLVEMRRCFNLIRYRAGLPGITVTETANPVKMRELIERERQIEMAWENRRYFDLRRNKRAVLFENAPVLGLNVTAKEAERDLFYNIVQVREMPYLYRVFTDRQTFWPIPRAEIDKNPNLSQMPGY
jgi:hypothetical protein